MLNRVLTYIAFSRTNPSFLFRRLFREKSSWVSSSGNPLMEWPSQSSGPRPSRKYKLLNHEIKTKGAGIINNEDVETMASLQLQTDLSIICKVLTDSLHNASILLEEALCQTGIQPYPSLLLSVIGTKKFPVKPLFSLFNWANKQPGFITNSSLFNSMIDLLAKEREFDSAWTLLLDFIENKSDKFSSEIPISDCFTVLMRRYARAGMPESSIRTFEFGENLMLTQHKDATLSSNRDFLVVLLDALCKEGYVQNASNYLIQRQESIQKQTPFLLTQLYNILLNGWFRQRNLRKAERVFKEMKAQGLIPTVFTYGTLVEGYCTLRKVQRAIELLDEMKVSNIAPNMIIFNPIVDALAESGRFKEALGLIERFPIYGLSPNISTFNSLVKGFCKLNDLVGASKILKMMLNYGCLPTSTTYNYFFKNFSKFGKMEEGMNLYTKMIESGYEPDRLTYQLLIKLLCEHDRLVLAIQIIREMNARGFDSDLATSTMLIHLLCKLRRLEDACAEFETMLRKGIVPQFLTYKMLTGELNKSGRHQLSKKLSELMTRVPHSVRLPDTYRRENKSYYLRSSIMQKAEEISNVLKTYRDHPEKLSDTRGRGSFTSCLVRAKELVMSIERRMSASECSPIRHSCECRALDGDNNTDC